MTGANKGIGFAIVRRLCKDFDGDVILTGLRSSICLLSLETISSIARDADRGKAACKELESEGLRPRFHQLDLDDVASVSQLKLFLEKTYGGLDVLVNNAGIAYKVNHRVFRMGTSRYLWSRANQRHLRASRRK